jgi:hypothetical protein
MLESQLGRVEKLPLRPPGELGRPLPVPPGEPTFAADTIHPIPYDRVADVHQVDSDLMGSTRLELRRDQIRGSPSFQNPEVRHRPSTPIYHPHSLSI